MNKDRILELMARKLSGDATPEELRELREQLSDDPAAGEHSRVLEQFWSRHDDGMHPSVEENLKKVLANLSLPAATPAPQTGDRATALLVAGQKETEIAGQRGWSRRLLVAAAVIGVLAAGTLLMVLRHGESRDLQASLMEKHNAKGTKSIIQLPDGSKIWLNADSKIRYPESFRGTNREIYLDGEAFFDVVKSPDHPFIIHLANGTVRVLGTSFNVRAYDNEPVVETSVATGRIAFIPRYRSAHKKQDSVVVAANHKASYAFTKEELRTTPTSSLEDKAWTEGKLIFKGMTMEQIAVELERNFGKKVVFVDHTPMTYVFTGAFENNTLEEIMYYLSQTKNFSYKITNTELLIASEAAQLSN